MMQRTPLFASHQKLGGKLIEFGGWEMPVQYTSIVDEHLAVRRGAGIFDISHMGEVLVEGPSAEAFLNYVLTNDVRKLVAGQGQYTLMCNERGGVVDDLYVYCLGPARGGGGLVQPGGNEYLMIVNASRIPADMDWLEAQWYRYPARAAVRLSNISEKTGAVALQGPRTPEFIGHCFSGASSAGTLVSLVTELKKNEIAKFGYEGSEVWISRTGYTGEDGFELIAPAEAISAIWERLLQTGQPYGLKPAGLGARDTLRTEMCYPLYGHELDENTTPIEAGVGFFVGLDKPDFVGKSVLAEQKANGTQKKLVAFKMAEKSAPPRPHYPVWEPSAAGQGGAIGQVTSGTQSPSLGLGIGMAFVPPALGKAGTALEVEVRGRRYPAITVPKPIYRKTA